MYGEWCQEHIIASEFTAYQRINKCQCDVLRFLAEKGSHSVYDLAKQLKYRYPYMHKNTRKLEKMQLVEFRKDATGKRIRKLVELNLRGMTVFMLVWKANTEKRKRSIQNAIGKHPKLFPFSKQLDKIEEIVGEEMLHRELSRTVVNISNGKHVEIEIDHLNLRFPAFIYSFTGRFFMRTKTDFKGEERNQRFADFLASQDELKKAYISFLAIQDILDLAEGSLEIGELTKFRSEGELAFFEKRNISSDPLFLGERLLEIFPKYAEMKSVFTGSLMKRLLWKAKPTLEEGNGFHVYFP